MLPAMDGIFLPIGRHPATLKEIQQRFVVEAPHSQHRSAIFHALMAWAVQVWNLLPTARLWVDGGFITHKEEPPKDVDVALLVRRSELAALGDSEWAILDGLLTDGSSGVRVQPMGGLVDGFMIERGEPAAVAYWDHAWSGVYDEDGARIEDIAKGYVVVKP